MQKRVHLASIKTISIFQIWLLISTTFALAFLLSQEFPVVQAAEIRGSFTSDNKFIAGTGGEWTLNDATGQAVQRAGDTIVKSVQVAKDASGNLVANIESAKLEINTAPTVANIPTGASIPASTAITINREVLTQQTLTSSSTSFSVAAKIGDKSIDLARMDNVASQSGEVLKNTFVDKGGNVYQQLSDGTFKAISTAGYSGGSLGVGPFTLATSQNFFVGNLYTGISHALVVVGVVSMIAALAGLDGQQTKAVSLAAAGGIISYRLLVGAFGRGGGVAGNQGVLAQALSNKAAGGIAFGIAVIIFVALYKKETQKTVTFQCLPWEPVLGGAKCEECNKDPFKPCSEYRCKSLGQACELLNPNTDNAQCAWVSKGDVQSPTIQEWTSALRPTNLQYTPSNAVRPGARGVSIVSPDAQDGCLPAFTDLQFGVITNEPAQCKIDYNRSVDFDSMQYYFGESNFYEYNHTQRMKLPSPASDDSDLSPILQNDGTFALSVRCRDANGNVNEDEYTINFCVQSGPDTTPPIVEGTSIESGSPVRFGADAVPIEVYTNEPATCKWSTQDRDYTEMENTLKCASDSSQINADLQYTCSGNFTGVANDASEDFYIRCSDQPSSPESERNTMTESYKLSLRGSSQLTLLNAGPNATIISASTGAVPVELFAQTDDGADAGKATCYFSSSGSPGSYVEFYETDAVDHKQTLSLSSGNYTYAIRCIDAGGNNAETNISFGVGVDKSAPQVARVYKRGDDALQIITNEDAQCFYSKTSCNFDIDEGLQMTNPSADQLRVHLTEWKAKSLYYIKCKDAYGNQPSPNSCSIVVSGADISAKAVIV